MIQLAEASPTAPVPPQNLDAEESVLGAMMLSPGAIGAVSEVLSAGGLLSPAPRRDARAPGAAPRRPGSGPPRLGTAGRDRRSRRPRRADGVRARAAARDERGEPHRATGQGGPPTEAPP